jgi:hypothetical protein
MRFLIVFVMDPLPLNNLLLCSGDTASSLQESPDAFKLFLGCGPHCAVSLWGSSGLRETTRFLIARAGTTIKRQRLIWDNLVDYVRAAWLRCLWLCKQVLEVKMKHLLGFDKSLGIHRELCNRYGRIVRWPHERFY